MPFTQFSNLDFDQIKTQIKNYLRANSTFTDFDFEGSNFSVLIDTLAYNTYITSFNANMVVNESFLDSATLRENVVSLARNIGYVPRSRTAATADISFEVVTKTSTPTMTLKAGLVCTGNFDDTSYVFSIPEDITTTHLVVLVVSVFGTSDAPIKIYEGYFNKKIHVWWFIRSKIYSKRSFIDTSTIVVFVGDREYKKVDNILRVDKDSEIFLLQEVQDEKYEILFGDINWWNSEMSANIVSYITTNGTSGNDLVFFICWKCWTTEISITPVNTPNIVTITSASNGGDIETIDSIKYFAPRLYSSQYRAVTSRDYEAIVPLIYPNTESISVIGGEDLDPPQFGTVFISIKPKNGEFISDFDKVQILNNLKNYSLTGINQKIVDLQILYVELDSFVYYNSAQVTNVGDLKTRVTSSLSTYSQSREVNKIGGRFKYSKVFNVIDNVDKAITSNITRVTIRRNLQVLTNQFAQYELCFGNQFNVKPGGFNIKSTKFQIAGEAGECFLTDTPNADLKTGIISIVKTDSRNDTDSVIAQSAGTVDYVKGDIILTTINITSTAKPNNVIEIQAFPESNDVIGLKDIYLDF